MLRTQRTQAGRQSLNILKGVTFAVGGWIALGVIFDLSFAQPYFLLALWGGALVLMLLSRLLVRFVFT